MRRMTREALDSSMRRKVSFMKLKALLKDVIESL